MADQAPLVLLVEDDPQDVQLTLRALQQSDEFPCRVEVARDGEEALEFLLERTGKERPRLVLLDLKLPKIDGLQVLAEIRASERGRTIPVVVLTSSGEHRDVSRCYELGVNSYVQKPVDIAEFRNAVRSVALYWIGLNLPPA